MTKWLFAILGMMSIMFGILSGNLQQLLSGAILNGLFLIMCELEEIKEKLK